MDEELHLFVPSDDDEDLCDDCDLSRSAQCHFYDKGTDVHTHYLVERNVEAQRPRRDG